MSKIGFTATGSETPKAVTVACTTCGRKARDRFGKARTFVDGALRRVFKKVRQGKGFAGYSFTTAKHGTRLQITSVTCPECRQRARDEARAIADTYPVQRAKILKAVGAAFAVPKSVLY